VQQLIGRPDTVIVAGGLTVLIGIEIGWRAIHSINSARRAWLDMSDLSQPNGQPILSVAPRRLTGEGQAPPTFAPKESEV
jgi:hypothetical protein